MEIHGRRTIVVGFALGMLLQPSSAWAAQEISGRIKIEPPYPEAKMIKVRKKTQDSCAEERISKSLLVSSEGDVANTVVWLEGEFSAQGGSLPRPKAGASGGQTQFIPSQPAILDQSGCNFEPHVVLIPPGGRLQILNSDPLAHDVRAFEEAFMLFRLDMDTKAKPEERTFDKSGIYTIRCGLHPWMHAFAVQAAHPFYAVTDAQGRFRMQNVPKGKHRLHIWHETLGETTVHLEVTGPMADFSYTFGRIPK